MTPATATNHFLLKEKPLSPAALFAIGFGVCLLIIGAQLLSIPTIIFAVLPLLVTAGLYFARSASGALHLFIGTSFSLAFRMVAKPGTDIIDLLAGLAMGGVLIIWTVRLLYFERENLTYDPPHLLAALYVAWGLLIGIGGILWWNNTLNDWVRELLIQCPVFVVPMLYVRLYEPESKGEKQFQLFIFVAALCIMVASVGRYAVALTQSSYAYQIGRIASEQSPSIVLFFVCIAFSLYKVPSLSTLSRLLLAAFCVAMLILSGYRTLWVAVVIVTVIMFLLTDRVTWSRGLKFLLALGGILASVGTYLFFTVRIFQIFAMMTYNRVLSTTAVSTDASLVNRYIETAIVEKHVMQSPFVGYGFGATFQTFDWLLGYSYNIGFSHNGFFFVAFKTGIIGFALFFSAYVWFMVKAFRLARDTYETAHTRAIAAVAFCYFCCQLISNLTLNFFGDRNAMIWFGLFWAFIISREIAKKNRSRAAITPANVGY